MTDGLKKKNVEGFTKWLKGFNDGGSGCSGERRRFSKK